MFRRDPRLLCYDEPFNPKLGLLPDSHAKGTWTEFVRLYQSDPELFKLRFAPISKQEELQPGLTEAQTEYLRWLLSQAEHVVLDFTRCHYKLDSLHRLAPDAVFVHLHRRPESVATSHLLPGGTVGGARRRISNAGRRPSFWWRRSGYDNWGFETIIGNDAIGVFGGHLREIGVDAERVFAEPAVARVMAYWYVAYRRVEEDGARLFGQNFLSVPYEEFCAAPDEVLRRIYSAWGMTMSLDLDTSSVRPPKPPYQAGSERWTQILARLARAGVEPP